MTELHVGKQHGTGTKSLMRNMPSVCASISRKMSGMVMRCSGSCCMNRPAWKAGWKLTPSTAGWCNPNRTISPISCSFTPRSIAGTSTTLQPISPSRSNAFSFLVEYVRFATDDAIGLAGEAVELEVDRRLDLGQLRQKRIVVSDPLAVRIEHHVADVLGLCRAEHRHDLRVDSRLTTGELDDFGMALRADEAVQDVLDLLERETEALARVGEAQRAPHVAGAVHFDDAKASVLLVVRAQPAVVRTTMLDATGEGEWDRAWLVEPGLRGVCLSIAVHQGFEATVRGATLAHEDLAIAEHDLGVDRPPTLGADAAGQLVEDVVGILSGWSLPADCLLIRHLPSVTRCTARQP